MAQQSRIRRLILDDLTRTIEILHQDPLRYSDGNYPEAGWISHFLTDDRCVSLGLFHNDDMVAVLITEKLSLNGCLMWFIAVDQQKQGSGFGTELLRYFEKHAGDYGIEWVFLNATKNSLDFYRKNEYITGNSAAVYEHYKDLK